jgi:hypothetical protein
MARPLFGRAVGIRCAICARRKNPILNSLIHPFWPARKSGSNAESLFAQENHRLNAA